MTMYYNVWYGREQKDYNTIMLGDTMLYYIPEAMLNMLITTAKLLIDTENISCM